MENIELIKANCDFISKKNQNEHTNFKIRCANVLFKFRKMCHVKQVLKHDEFSCPKCDSLAYNEQQLENYYSIYGSAEYPKDRCDAEYTVRQMEKDVQAAKDHKWINAHQRNEFSHSRSHLTYEDIIIVMDFTGIGEYGAIKKFQNLVLSPISLDEQKKELLHYFDFFLDATNGIHFFVTKMNIL